MIVCERERERDRGKEMEIKRSMDKENVRRGGVEVGKVDSRLKAKREGRKENREKK